MLFEDEESLRADVEANEKEKAAGEDEGEGEDGKTDHEKSTDGGDDANGALAAAVGGGEKSTYMDTVKELRTLLGIIEAASSDDDNEPPQSKKEESELRAKAQEALAALFVTEIQKQIGMDRYKTADNVPVPVSLDDIQSVPTKRRKYLPLRERDMSPPTFGHLPIAFPKLPRASSKYPPIAHPRPTLHNH